MFTGIVTDVGRVLEVRQDGDLRARIGTGYAVGGIDIGASIACEGVCLTVIAKGVTEAGQGWFDVQISAETVSKTNIGRNGWPVGRRLNLERALKAGEELGGHIVTGHVDGVARIKDIRSDGDSRRFTFEVPAELARYIAGKGSVALDGTSLTVNETGSTTFGINLIPHTLTVSTWGRKKPGDEVNLEVDLFARYVARLMEFRT